MSNSSKSEHVTLVRSFDAELTPGDGRTLDMRVVPYNVPATVADPPLCKPYQEMFVPGAFERQVAAPDRVRVWLNFEHEDGLRGIVGHGVELHERNDGLGGTFRVHDNSDGDKALQLVNDGLLTGVSMEFVALRSRVVDGVVQRLRAHIDKVSLCRSPAYPAAQVLAVRQVANDGSGTIPASANYRPGVHGGQTCLTCEYWDEGVCALFNAPVDEDYLCDEWEADDDIAEDMSDGEEDDDATDGIDIDITVNVSQVDADADAEDPAARSEIDARLAALGVRVMRRVATTSKSWDGSPARFTDEQYKRAALLCRPGDGSAKELCSLPVLEPDGTLNVNALGPAAGALAGARGGLHSVSPQLKAQAARKLVRLYGQAKMQPPESLIALARK